MSRGSKDAASEPVSAPDAPIADAAWRRSHPYSTTSGLLLGAAALPPLVGFATQAPPDAWPSDARSLALLAGSVATAGLALAGGLVIPTRASTGRRLATLATFGLLGLSAPLLSRQPALALAVGLLTLFVLSLLWSWGFVPVGRLRRRGPLLQNRARGAAAAALALWIGLVLLRRGPAPHELAALGAALGLASGMGVAWALLEWRRHPVRAGAELCALLAWFAIALASGFDLERTVDGLALTAGATWIVLPPREPLAGQSGTVWDLLLGHPERLFVGTFAGLCALGALGLALPYATPAPTGIAFIDALFMAVSAVCVTGLAVVDPARDLSAFGQVLLLALIQLGGLGIMTFSTAALRAFGRRMSLRHEGAVASLISPRDRAQLFDSAQHVLVVTLASELLGAAALLPRFLAHGDPLPLAAWRALFTAVSAFCNAGFALQADSLIGFQADPWVLHVVGGLIVIGGLAPASIVALPALLGWRTRPVSAQVKLSLGMAVVLLVAGFALTLGFEWQHSLVELAPLDRVHNAWFHSVTLRTAGFNSIDLAALRPVTISMMLVLMFIGGSPGGTAGGIKTTTAAVLVLGVIAAVRGRWDVTVFGRQLAARTLQKATVVATLGLAAIVAGILALQVTQDLGAAEAIFEVVSASATVGLSLGATPRLDEVGKLIIVACMFAGRVGPLSILMFLGQRRAQVLVRRPEEEVDVG